MKSILYSLFGNYTPNTYEVTTSVTNAEGITTTTVADVIPDGLAGVDLEFISGVFLFGIALYCTYRLIGMALGGGR